MPAETPVTSPETELTAATVGSLLVQIPNGEVSLRVVIDPAHIVPVPVIGAGVMFMRNNVVIKQPVGNV